MYLPSHFKENDLAWAHEFIRALGAGTLVTRGATKLHANFLPWHLSEDGATLRGHLARANPQTLDLEVCAAGTNHEKREGLVIFQGVNSYISPSYYPSKVRTERVVPTWNYEMAQAIGTFTVHDDAQWLREFLPTLTAMHENRRAFPWKVSDAPDDYIEGLLTQIVGVEIAIERIEAKRKLSQNKSEADGDRWGTILGLREDGIHDVADAMERNEGP